jgi:hypothetical protein
VQTLLQFSLHFRQRLAAGFSKLLKANVARVAKLADARDLKSRVPNGTCGFDSRPGHQINSILFISLAIQPASQSGCRIDPFRASWCPTGAQIRPQPEPRFSSRVRGYRLPLVGTNSTYSIQNVKNFPFPPRSVFVHPSIAGLAIIGWKSPFTGSVNVSGFFSDLDPTGFNGVIWSVDLGSQPLATGTIAKGGAGTDIQPYKCLGQGRSGSLFHCRPGRRLHIRCYWHGRDSHQSAAQ